jgi:hypothetical protein
LVGRHLRFKESLERPSICDIANAPEASPHTGKMRDAQNRSFETHRASHGNAENVSLELAQQVVARCAAVNNPDLEG